MRLLRTGKNDVPREEEIRSLVRLAMGAAPRGEYGDHPTEYALASYLEGSLAAGAEDEGVAGDVKAPGAGVEDRPVTGTAGADDVRPGVGVAVVGFGVGVGVGSATSGAHSPCG